MTEDAPDRFRANVATSPDPLLKALPIDIEEPPRPEFYGLPTDTSH